MSAHLGSDRDNDLDPPFCRRALLMDANNGGIDHLHLTIMDFGDGVHEAVPHTCFPPSHEAIVAGGAWAISLRQVSPWSSRSQHPEDTVEHPTVVDTRHTTRFVGEMRLDRAPFEVGQIISAHEESESDFAAI